MSEDTEKFLHDVTQTQEKESNANKDILEANIGALGRWHIITCLALFLVKFPVAWHQLSIVFEAAPTEFACVNASINKCAADCPQRIFNRSVFTETIASEWDLVCEKNYLTNLTQTITMLGILFGNMIFGYLSDKYGRKYPLLAAVLIQATSGTIAAIAPWFPLFLFMKFLVALATGGTMVTSFVLTMELIGTKWRTILGILYQIPFNLGHLLLPIISYFLRDWRHFQAAISLPSLILISYYWILPESPSEKNKEASKGNILDLVRTPIMRMYTIAICFNWLVCGLCFFGVSQFIGQLGGDIFVNVALSAVIQIPSTIFACWSTKAWGRKKTLIFANVVAGTSLILIGIVPSNPTWMKTVLSTAGIFGLALAFPTVYIYSGELFPTMVRNVGVGTSSMCARFGSMVAPFVSSLVSIEAWIPPLIFGVVPLIGAVLCYKLPETLDCKLPDTIEEAEMFEKQAHKIKKVKHYNVNSSGTEMDGC